MIKSAAQVWPIYTIYDVVQKPIFILFFFRKDGFHCEKVLVETEWWLEMIYVKKMKLAPWFWRAMDKCNSKSIIMDSKLLLCYYCINFF